jgi:hypothetical protein
MNNRRTRTWLWAIAVVGPALLWWRFESAPKASSEPVRTVFVQAGVGDTNTQSGNEEPATVRVSEKADTDSIIERRREWEAETDPNRINEIQPELEALVNDANVAEIVRALPSELLKTPFGLEVLKRWARLDPKAALDWAMHETDDVVRRALLVEVSFQMAQRDPARAVALAERFDLGQGSGAVLENLAQQWADRDFPAAHTWVLGQPAGDLRDELVGRVAFVWSHREPAEAARLVVEQIPPGPVQTEAAMSVLHQWAQLDFAAATGWVEQFPKNSLRERAQYELAGIARYRSELGAVQ